MKTPTAKSAAGNFGLTFGATAAAIEKQLGAEGLKLPHEDARHKQQDADAITRLVVRGLLTESEARQARRRLLKRIAGLVTPAPSATTDSGERREGEE